MIPQRILNLAGATQIGNAPNMLNLGAAPPPQQVQAINPGGDVTPAALRRRAMMQALEEGNFTRPLNGGGWGEGLARFGEAYLSTRSARDQLARQEKADALDRQEAQIDRKMEREVNQARIDALRQPEASNDWQVGSSYTNAFRVRPDGTIEQGGEIPLRPYAPRSSASSQIPGLPPGFVLDQ